MKPHTNHPERKKRKRNNSSASSIKAQGRKLERAESELRKRMAEAVAILRKNPKGELYHRQLKTLKVLRMENSGGLIRELGNYVFDDQGNTIQDRLEEVIAALEEKT